jgi:hypothetical protein
MPSRHNTLLNEEEVPGHVTGTVEIQDVTETLESHYAPTKTYGNKNNYDKFPSISVKVTKCKFSTKCCLLVTEVTGQKPTQPRLNCQQNENRQ